MPISANQTLLAHIAMLCVIEQARHAHLKPPRERVMAALEEAIDDCRERMVDLALKGRTDTDEYRKVTAQLDKWSASWRSNR